MYKGVDPNDFNAWLFGMETVFDDDEINEEIELLNDYINMGYDAKRIYGELVGGNLGTYSSYGLLTKEKSK